MGNDVRYQVFISSPFKGLEEQRKAAVEAVINWGHIPIALERFSARASSDRVVIKRAIQDSQVYILILGHRIGSLMPDTNITYTEFEFDLARQSGLAILAFIQSSKEASSQLGVEGAISEKAAEIQRWADFRERIKEHGYAQPWGKDSNFEELVSRSFRILLDDTKIEKTPGWVRANKEIDETGVRTALKNSFVLDTVRNLNNFKLLDERCSQDVTLKEAAAEGFREFFQATVVEKSYDLFVESGSTPAFIARELCRSETFKRAIMREDFETCGFSIAVHAPTRPSPAILATNRRFREKVQQ